MQAKQNQINILTVKEGASILRVSETHIRNLIKKGSIRAYKEGRKGGFRFTVQSLLEYIRAKEEDYCNESY